MPLDFSRTWREKDLGVGRLDAECAEASDWLESRLERGRARELTDEFAEDEA